ncbi:hypothetical protein UCRNP2_4385 [Neofusicoccum parvum UCRNP2]|uniref:DUF6604 domain-containing protein n=1 Tax=Botryosphaeria parva (strain UCR-NP2) TaxID=1287680 RepID=R1GKM8_BOTPV|nr:hypothetical protein UCRNP2_4385 [Neofusicoccum parvum UCRNP2]
MPEWGSKAERFLLHEVDLQELRLLLEDFQNIRITVQTLWKSYKRSAKEDLVSLAITINTAIETARRMEERAELGLQNGGDVITWLEALYLTTCSHMSEDPEYREQPDDAMNFATYDNSDEFFWPAYRLLHSIVENGDHQALLSYPAGTNAYTTPRHWERLSPREKYQHDQRLLSSITPDLITLASIEHLQAASLPTRDELTRALFESLTTGAICLWHVLALQLFLDTHHIMRARAADGFTHLERVASHIRASIEQHVQKKHYKLETAAWSSSDHNAFFALRSHVVTWIDDDRIRGALRARGRAVLPPRHNLFRKHPVLCGLFAYVLQMPFHAASVRFADALRSVSSAAHLYNAAIMEGLLAEKWPDMDVAGELQDGIFPGGWPEGVREYVAEYNRAHRDGREALCVGAPVWRAFRERYAGRAANVNLENNVVRKIIAQSLSPKDEDEQGAERADNEEAEVQLVPERLPDFLAKLYLALREEVPEVAFDYLMLHRSCWEILAGVKEKCGDMLKEILGADVVAPQCWKDQEFVPLVTLMAFMAALPPDGPTDREVKMTDEVSDLPIQVAAEKFEQWVEGGKGSEVADAAKKVCCV